MAVERTAVDDVEVSRAVVEAVAEAEGVSPIEVTPPLHDVIDPDALNQLFRPKWNDRTGAKVVSFTYADYEVTVRDGGIVVVRPSETEECTP